MRAHVLQKIVLLKKNWYIIQNILEKPNQEVLYQNAFDVV